MCQETDYVNKARNVYPDSCVAVYRLCLLLRKKNDLMVSSLAVSDSDQLGNADTISENITI